MAQGNPHMDDPLQSEAIVLLDEIELHLHPAWQQRILSDLMADIPQRAIHRFYPQPAGANDS